MLTSQPSSSLSSLRRRRPLSRRTSTELYRAFERWAFDAKGYSRDTRRNYYLTGLRAEKYLRQARSTSLLYADAKDLKAFLFSLPATAASRNQARNGLVALFSFFIDQGLCDSNPAQGLPRLPTPEKLPRPLGPQQARNAEKVSETFPPQERMLFKTALYTGMRRAELLRFEWTMIEEGWIRFTGKGNKERMIPLHRNLETELNAWRGQCPSPRWVFPSPLDPTRHASSSWALDRFRALGDMIGVEKLHPHRFRHTFATQTLNSGADIATVGSLMGHSKLSTTQRYAKVREPRLQRAIETLDYRST